MKANWKKKTHQQSVITGDESPKTTTDHLEWSLDNQ